MEEEKEGTGWQVSACLNGRIHMGMPEGWERPAETVLSERFPGSTGPEEIFADSGADRMLTLSRLGKHLQERQVYPAVREIQRVVSRVYPESVRDQAQTITVQTGSAGFFSFLTGGMAGDVCHFLFILPDAEERMLLGGLHLPAGELRSGKELLVKIIRSIKEEDTGRKSQ